MFFDTQMVNAVKIEQRLEMDKALAAGPLGPVDPSWRKAMGALARVWARRPGAHAVTARRHERLVPTTQVR